MGWPTASIRTKNWGTEILTDADQEAQLDLLHTYNNDQLNGTTGHGHTGSTNDGPKITLTTGVQGTLPLANGGTGVTTLAALIALAVPSGFIGMWSGTIATIPSGWVLCDGNNSTPNLTNRFIVAADADSGGAAKSTITGSALQTSDTGVMPAHTHTSDLRTSLGSNTLPTGGLGASVGTLTTSSTGTGTKVIAVFYALAYIMKT